MPKLLINFYLLQRFLQQARKFFFIKIKIIKGYFRAFIRTLYITFPYLFILKKHSNYRPVGRPKIIFILVGRPVIFLVAASLFSSINRKVIT